MRIGELGGRRKHCKIHKSPRPAGNFYHLPGEMGAMEAGGNGVTLIGHLADYNRLVSRHLSAVVLIYYVPRESHRNGAAI